MTLAPGTSSTSCDIERDRSPLTRSGLLGLAWQRGGFLVWRAMGERHLGATCGMLTYENVLQDALLRLQRFGIDEVRARPPPSVLTHALTSGSVIAGDRDAIHQGRQEHARYEGLLPRPYERQVPAG